MKLIRVVLLSIILMSIVLLTGCLTTETKEYRFKINSDGSGEGVIKYVNIVSEEDEEKNVSFKDFGELVSDYMEGTKLEEENPHLNMINKKLYEENGVLCGDFSFTFDFADSIGFYRDSSCKCAPFMYHLGSLSETFVESNGEYKGENFPVLVWPADTKDFYFKTVVKEDMSDGHSLLPLYKTWSEQQ